MGEHTDDQSRRGKTQGVMRCRLISKAGIPVGSVLSSQPRGRCCARVCPILFCRRLLGRQIALSGGAVVTWCRRCLAVNDVNRTGFMVLTEFPYVWRDSACVRLARVVPRSMTGTAREKKTQRKERERPREPVAREIIRLFKKPLAT